MRNRWGSLSLDVPTGWDDESFVILRGPALQTGVRMRAPTGEPRRPVLVVKRVPLSSTATLAELFAIEEQTVLATVEGAELLERSELVVGGAPALAREVRFVAPDGKMRQLHVGVVAGGSFYVFVGTSTDDLEWKALVAGWRTLLESASFD
jgi:hypothetical protein